MRVNIVTMIQFSKSSQRCENSFANIMKLSNKMRRILVVIILVLSVFGLLYLQSRSTLVYEWLGPTTNERAVSKPTDRVPLVVFNRVPKCGSTFMIGLVVSLGIENRFKVEVPEYKNGESPLFSEKKQSDFITFFNNQTAPYMYIRHQYFINFERFREQQPTYINMIRDPLARFESFYYFMRFGNTRGDGGHQNMSDERRKETIDDCIMKQRTVCVNPYWVLVPYFCGNEPACQIRNQQAVDKAKENIKKYYLFVGILEELNDSLKILGRLLPPYFNNVTEIVKQQRNQVMRNDTITMKKKPASDAARNYLRTQTSIRLEYDVYNFVLERFREQKRRLL